MSSSNQQLNPNLLAPLMPDKVLRRAIEVLSVPSTDKNELLMGYYILRQLEKLKIPSEIDIHGNILVQKGTGNRPCFCAHMDTVHSYKSGFHVKSSGKIKDGESDAGARLYLYAEDDERKAVGIGGDDKCGIFVCLELLRVIPNIKVVFFSSEESGGSGSANVNLTFFDDCNFLGGIDRWNGHDFINTYMGDKTISKGFTKDISPILKRYGLSFESGLFTDSFNVMRRKVGISCFNVSCGYYRHHSNEEYVDTNELYHCFLLCQELCKLNTRYEYILPPPKYAYNWKKDDWSKKPHYKWEKGPDGVWRSYPATTGYYDVILKKWVYSSDSTVIPEEEEDDKAEPTRFCIACGMVLRNDETFYCSFCDSSRDYSGHSFNYGTD